MTIIPTIILSMGTNIFVTNIREVSLNKLIIHILKTAKELEYNNEDVSARFIL